MEFLKINFDNLKLFPTLSNIDEEIIIEFDVDSNHIHDLILNLDIKVLIIFI